MRLYYTSHLRQYDYAMLEVGADVPHHHQNQLIPPKLPEYRTMGYCHNECLKSVGTTFMPVSLGKLLNDKFLRKLFYFLFPFLRLDRICDRKSVFNNGNWQKHKNHQFQFCTLKNQQKTIANIMHNTLYSCACHYAH